MKRLIKFRGKKNSNDLYWYFGFYYNIDDVEHFLMVKSPLGLVHIQVDPKTVGQFTGFYDENKEEIYDGDCVTFGKSKTKYFVYWNKTSWHCISDEGDDYGSYMTRIDNNEKKYLVKP